MKRILFSHYENIAQGQKFLIIGSGYSILKYQKEIKNFIDLNNLITIGINKMNHIFVPEFHLWTNNQRFRDFGNDINKCSKLMLGCNIKKELIESRWKSDYIMVNYIDKKEIPLGYKDGAITGHFRTAGCLAIFLAHIMGSNNIFVVGMDGYTFYSQPELKNKEKNHHCYGRGYTDDAEWKKCQQKDKIVCETLRELREYGIKFKIITPTVFKEFYDFSLLGEYYG